VKAVSCHAVVLLLLTGAVVNGPYSLITTAVSADLGTHPCLHGNAKALATVSAIIDGTGSIGERPLCCNHNIYSFSPGPMWAPWR